MDDGQLSIRWTGGDLLPQELVNVLTENADTSKQSDDEIPQLENLDKHLWRLSPKLVLFSSHEALQLSAIIICVKYTLLNDQYINCHWYTWFYVVLSMHYEILHLSVKFRTQLLY